MAGPNQDPRSIPQLLSSLTSDLSSLVRQEFQLAKTEMSEKISAVGKGAAEVAVGGVLLFAALLLVLQAVVIALADAIGLGWASLIVGVVVAIGGYLVLKAGMNAAKPKNLKPERATHQIGEDVRLAKKQVK